MKAIRIHEFGKPDVMKLEDIDIPQPAGDEVLIKVYASSVNPVDLKIIAGKAQEKFPTQFPLTIGWDVSGVVDRVGDKVSGFAPGDEVYGRPYPTIDGAFAEYIVMKASEISYKPKSIDHLYAAAIPLAGLTAWQGLFEYGKLERGQKVLIHGASGGVGSFAAQFAKLKGAHVIGTASQSNLDLVKNLGTDEVVDYKRERFEDRLQDADLVFDLIGGETQQRSINVLKEGGRMVTTVMPQYQQEARVKNNKLEGFTAQSYPEDLQQIASLIDQGQVRPVISHTLALADAKEAELLSEKGSIQGKVVIKII